MLLVPARARAQTPALTPLRVAIAPSDGVTAVVYAKMAGLFERAGLDVHMDTQSNGAAVAAAIVSGSYDVGNSGTTSILLAHEKGLPFSVIAPAGVYGGKPAFSGALALKDSPLRLGKDAENEVIGLVSLAGIGHDAFCGWIDQHGGDPAKVRFVEIPFTASALALEQHRVIAAETAEPVMTTALDTGKFRLIPVYDAIAPAFLMSAWFTSLEFSAKHPETVRTFARVVAAAATYGNAHHAETAPAMAQITGIPLDVMLHIPRASLGATLSPGLIQPVIAAAAKYGSLKKPFPAEELIDRTLSP